MEPKILVVEDDPETLDEVAMMLEEHGYQVAVASDGLQGLAVALSESPQLVVTDLRMPAMNGLEMVRQLRRHHRTRLTPILVMTGFGMEHHTVAIMAGADQVLGKPFTSDVLISLVRSLIRGNNCEAQVDGTKNLAEIPRPSGRSS